MGSTMILFLLFLFLLVIATPLNRLKDNLRVSLKQISNGDTRFVETSTGRELYFHGVNAVVKGPPYFPLLDSFDIDISFSEQDFQMMNTLGLNMVRLGTMWPGLQPNQTGYNATYIDLVKRFSQMAQEYDIYVLYDMHQDVLSADYCGEGIPRWAVQPKANSSLFGFPFPVAEPYKNRNKDGFPTRQDCGKKSWGDYYFSRMASSAFHSLYTDHNNLRKAWGAFWQQVALIATQNPYTLGLELINEPWAGDIYDYPDLLIPSVSDDLILQPAYDALNNYIRQIDNQLLIFFAGVTWDDIVPVGFRHAPGGEQYANRSVLAYHWYSPPQDKNLRREYFAERTRDGRRLNTGTMLTETQGPSADGNMENDTFIKTVHLAEQYLQSWSAWEWKTFCKETNETIHSQSIWAAYGACITGYGGRVVWNDKGQENPAGMKKYARTYAYAVAGEALSAEFDATTSRYDFNYKIDITIKEPTLIYANEKLNYPSGVSILVSPSGALSITRVKENHYALSPTSSVRQYQNITVVVTTSS